MSSAPVSDSDYIERYYKKSLAHSRVDFSLATTAEDRVEYHLFNSPTEETGRLFTHATISSVQIDKDLPTKIFFHGWTSDTTSPWYQLLRNEYFRKSPCNVIYVDWSYDGKQAYPQSSGNIHTVGRYIAKLLVDLGISPTNLHLVGHSLGSHLTGFIGKNYGEIRGAKLARITALDPAGPAFYTAPSEHRLCEKDADFVDVIHTDIGNYGYVHPLGHVDFYPNGGRNQPGTEHTIDVNSSHARSTLFFAESINKKVRSKEGKLDEEKLLVTEVANGREVTFGDGVETDSRGVFYLKSNADHPYLA